MSESNIIGRISEKEKLNELFQAENPCLFLFYGRRRIGKTFLISEFFKDRNDCWFLSFKAEYELRDSPEIQSYNIRKEVDNFLSDHKIENNLIFKKDEPLWAETFRYLEQCIILLQKKDISKKIIVFFDEIPWFYSKKTKKYFIGIFSHFWSKFILQNKEKEKIKVFASGSATKAIIDDLISAKGALFQNKDKSVMKLSPFNLKEIKEFLNKKEIFLSNEDIIRLHFAIGGVADYLEQFKPHQTVNQFIEEFYLKNEKTYNNGLTDFLKSSFDEGLNHKIILDAIALSKKGMTQSELQTKTKLSPRDLAKTLFELTEAGIIEPSHELSPSSKINRESRNKSISVKSSSRSKPKNIKYKIYDEMVLFFYYWINGIQFTNSLHWNPTGSLHKDWKGRMFEIICKKNIDLIIKQKKYPTLTNYEIHYWSNSKADIDLLADRTDNAIDIFEMKCYEKGYEMSKDYLNDLFKKRLEMKNWLLSLVNKKLKPYKEKNVLITIISFTDATIPKDCRGSEKVSDVIVFSNLF